MDNSLNRRPRLSGTSVLGSGARATLRKTSSLQRPHGHADFIAIIAATLGSEPYLLLMCCARFSGRTQHWRFDHTQRAIFRYTFASNIARNDGGASLAAAGASISIFFAMRLPTLFAWHFKWCCGGNDGGAVFGENSGPDRCSRLQAHLVQPSSFIVWRVVELARHRKD